MKHFQQLENIPITGVYVYTVPVSTQDCENDPNYDLDQVQKLTEIQMMRPLGLDETFPH